MLSCRSDGTSRLLGSLDQALHAALLTGGCILVNDLGSTGFVQALGGNAVLAFSTCDVSSFDRRQNLLDFGLGSRLDRLVSHTANFGLFQAFDGAFGIGHWSKIKVVEGRICPLASFLSASFLSASFDWNWLGQNGASVVQAPAAIPWKGGQSEETSGPRRQSSIGRSSESRGPETEVTGQIPPFHLMGSPTV